MDNLARWGKNAHPMLQMKITSTHVRARLIAIKKLVFRGKVQEIRFMQVVTADGDKRVLLPDIKPGQSFEYESGPEGIKLTPVNTVESDIPEVKMVCDPDGFYHFPEGVKITRAQIRAAIRMDRDGELLGLECVD